MNEFKMIAESYNKMIEKGQATKEDVASSIKVYEFLATCSKEDINELFNSSVFNTIAKCYTKRALNNVTSITEQQKKEVLRELDFAFDTATAKEILKDYDN